jgi:hypothetical protein
MQEAIAGATEFYLQAEQISCRCPVCKLGVIKAEQRIQTFKHYWPAVVGYIRPKLA